MPWNPRDSTRKVQLFELLTRYARITANEYAALVGWYPVRDAHAYLRRHWRRGNIKRKRGSLGVYEYSLGASGAKYLLWWKLKFPDERIAI